MQLLNIDLKQLRGLGRQGVRAQQGTARLGARQRASGRRRREPAGARHPRVEGAAGRREGAGRAGEGRDAGRPSAGRPEGQGDLGQLTHIATSSTGPRRVRGPVRVRPPDDEARSRCETDQPMAPPVEPPPSRWEFPPVGRGRRARHRRRRRRPRAGHAARGLPQRACSPCRCGGHGRIAWWSPDPRGVLPLDGLRVSRSLRKSCGRFEHPRRHAPSSEVIAACADRSGPRVDHAGRPRRVPPAAPAGLGPQRRGVDADGLAGGLYGVAVGGLFAGESMFHRATDASKVALVGLVASAPRGRAPRCSTCSGPPTTCARSAPSRCPGPSTCRSWPSARATAPHAFAQRPAGPSALRPNTQLGRAPA